MKKFTKLSMVFLAMVILALAGCSSDPNGPTPDGDGGDYDAIDGNDKADDPNGVVCDETGWCCNNSSCWQIQDTDGDADGDVDGDVGPITCSGDEDCQDGQVCSVKAGDICVECEDHWNCEDGDICDNIHTFTCLDGSVLDQFRWMEADWKCTEGEDVGEIFPLKLINWESDKLVVLAEGLPPFAVHSSWSFWYEGEILHGFAKTDAGDYESQDFSYDEENKEFHFMEFYPDTGDTYSWTYKLIQ